MAILDYRVIQSSGENTHAGDAVKEVVKGVQNYIDRGNGWKPTGGICVTFDGTYYTAFQAIFNG